MADGSITIAALLDTGAFQSSVAALENELSGLSGRLQTVVSAAVAGSGMEGMMQSVLGPLRTTLDNLRITAGEAARTAAQAAILTFGSSDWNGAGTRASGGLANGFAAGMGQIGASAVGAAQTARGAFQGDWYSIGAGMSSQIAAGIAGNAGSVAAAMASVAAQAMATAKEKLQIRSPSAKMREEVGVMLSRGIAEGILAGSSYIEAALAETGRNIHAPAIAGGGGEGGRYQQNIYLRTGTASPYQTARAIRQQSELMMRT